LLLIIPKLTKLNTPNTTSVSQKNQKTPGNTSFDKIITYKIKTIIKNFT